MNAAAATRSRSGKSSESCPFHDLGGEGEAYPEWLRVLKTARGAYAIRDAKTKEVLYVGSSRNSMYGTVTRHLQSWRRNKRWWSGSYGAGHDPGMTYPRAKCQVAVYLTPNADHLAEEARLIQLLKPRDNMVSHPDGSAPDPEEAPF